MSGLRGPARAQGTFAAVAKRVAAIIIRTAQVDRLELGVTMLTCERLLSFDTSSLSDDFSGGRFDR
jgi:hypothetical protein